MGRCACLSPQKQPNARETQRISSNLGPTMSSGARSTPGSIRPQIAVDADQSTGEAHNRSDARSENRVSCSDLASAAIMRYVLIGGY